MALLATQVIVPGGLADALAAAAGGGDTFVPDADTFIRVNNGGGGSITVTVAIPAKYHSLTVTNLSIAVPAGTSRMIGPFPSDVFADPANSGLGAITYSGVVTVTVGAFKVAPY